MKYVEFTGDSLCNACRTRKAKWSSGSQRYCELCKTGRENALKNKKRGDRALGTSTEQKEAA